jgi:sugar phosphate isomerase/epimerase
MKFGVCAGLDKLEMVTQAGYDFIEPPTRRTLHPEEGEEGFARIRGIMERSPIQAEAFNIFVPGSLKVTGPEVDFTRLMDYATLCVQRAPNIGGEVIVFGSGGARSVPEEFSRDEAKGQIIHFLQELGKSAEECGMKIAVEPLRKEESNIINSVSEGMEFVRAAESPAVGILADVYHMEKEKEPLDNILACGDNLLHIHIADPAERRAPGVGEYDFRPFFARLKKVGYDNRISIECKWEDFEAEAKAALKFAKEAWEQV